MAHHPRGPHVIASAAVFLGLACGGEQKAATEKAPTAAAAAPSAVAFSASPLTPDPGGKVITVELYSDAVGNYFKPAEVHAKPGDEIRYIDWNVYARHGILFVKEFTAEENIHVSVLLDTSKSMEFGGKFEAAKEVAAALGYIGLANYDTLTSLQAAFLLGGLFLSFSRGAWMHFAVSAAVAVAILIAASPDPRLRGRILLFAAVTAVGTALLVAAMMSIDTVRDLFLERAKAIQPYDVGPGGRF